LRHTSRCRDSRPPRQPKITPYPEQLRHQQQHQLPNSQVRDSYFLFFGIPFAMSYFPHQAFLRLRCDNVVHGPLHEGRKALSHVIPTPLPISPLHCFLLHCSWQSISTSPLLIQLYLLNGKFDTSMFVIANISKLSLRNTSRKPSPILHTAPTTRRCRIGLSRPRKSA
jgi:hypothetical protein